MATILVMTSGFHGIHALTLINSGFVAIGYTSFCGNSVIMQFFSPVTAGPKRSMGFYLNFLIRRYELQSLWVSGVIYHDLVIVISGCGHLDHDIQIWDSSGSSQIFLITDIKHWCISICGNFC